MRVTEVLLNGDSKRKDCHDGRMRIRVPITIKSHSAYKQILAPTAWTTVPTPVKLTPFQLALIRGCRWLEMLASGYVLSMKELAAQEGVDRSLVSRLLNLTTLAPEIVQLILDDALPPQVTLLNLAIDPPADWRQQRGSIREKRVKLRRTSTAPPQ